MACLCLPPPYSAYLEARRDDTMTTLMPFQAIKILPGDLEIQSFDRAEWRQNSKQGEDRIHARGEHQRKSYLLTAHPPHPAG